MLTCSYHSSSILLLSYLLLTRIVLLMFMWIEVNHPKFAIALWEFVSSQRAPPGQPFQPNSDPSIGGAVGVALSLNCIGVAVIMVSPIH